MNLTHLSTSIAVLPDEVDAETLLLLGDQIDFATKLLKEVRSRWESSMVKLIDREGPVKSGDILYRVGEPPKTTCLNLPGAVQAVLESVGGDFDQFCSHLSSGALKHGACSKTLAPEVYEQFFMVERKRELQTDEATPRRLSKLNLAFSR